MKAFAPNPSRSERFFAGYYWLIIKNLLGWPLMLASFVAGPLVPGPGGILLFLIGFALVTFPGKRKLTARVLRGRRIWLQNRPLIVIIIAVALVVPALVVVLGVTSRWLPAELIDPPLRAGGAYVAGVLLTAVAAYLAVLGVNLLLRAMPFIRRRVRPWLRKHHVRLLPPRRRHRLPHESGPGPFRLKDEILDFVRRR